MKNSFYQYLQKSETEYNEIWNEATIMLDTNVLLNIYRYSHESSKEFIDLLRNFEKRLKLPHQSGVELFNNRHTVIKQQISTQKDFLKSVGDLMQKIESKTEPPFISPSLLKTSKRFQNQIIKEINNSISKYQGYMVSDPYLEQFLELFEGRITPPFNAIELDKIKEEGVKRYEKKIPPGYKDYKKENSNSFGDLILWKQVIKYAKESGQPIILITDEKKEDWWWKVENNYTIGPRHELTDEIRKEANVDFLLVNSSSFIRNASLFFNKTPNENVISEIEQNKDLDFYMNMANKASRNQFKWLEIAESINKNRFFGLEALERESLLYKVSKSTTDLVNALNSNNIKPPVD